VRPYDAIAGFYDAWIQDVTEDVAFYVARARELGGPVVELGVGTGRVAVPTAAEGIRVIGIDHSQQMLEVCRRQAQEVGVGDLIDLRLGDFRRPPVPERVRLVTCPFRAFQHLESDQARREALAAARAMLEPGGRFIFDVFAMSSHTVGETLNDWTERAPGIWEHARWDWERRILNLSIRGPSGETELRFAWLGREEWRTLLESSGFEIFACYGWFDMSPCARSPFTVWVACRPS
jgi:ubiquinone/menaquinone biosynthesis C-methylase UbiE